MPLIVWSNALSVGIDEIDNQHKKLFKIANDLCDALMASAGKQVLGKTLDELIAYTKTHFAYEERIFAQTGYPGTPEHKKEHEDLTNQVIDVQKRFASGASAALSMEVMNFLRSWLINHIQGTDTKYVSHLKSHGIN